MERVCAFCRRRWKLLLCVFVFIIFAHVFLTGTVLAQEEKYYAPSLNVPIPGLDFTDYPVEKTGSTVSIPFFGAYVYTIYRYLLSIVVVVATIMFIYGAFMYLLGSAITSIQSGKKIMIDAIIGMLLLLSGYTILYVINPETTSVPSLTIERIDTALYFQEKAEGTYQSRIDDDPSIAGGTTVSGENRGCVGDARRYRVAPSACASAQACYEKYCVNKSDDVPEGIALQSDIKSFDYFPKKAEEQVEQYGLKMPSYVRSSQNGLRPEAHAALLRAGEIAKSRGYFIEVFDMYRSWEGNLAQFCKRMKENGNAGGMARPGNSPHNLGVAVDISLYTPYKGKDADNPFVFKKVEYNGVTYALRAGLPPLCGSNNVNTVDNTIVAGVEHLRELDQIMAEAGFYRYCQETWHYDFGGVYPTLDCTECAFPPKPPRGDFSRCSPKYLNRL